MRHSSDDTAYPNQDWFDDVRELGADPDVVFQPVPLDTTYPLDTIRFSNKQRLKYQCWLAQLCTLLACLTPLLRDTELREMLLAELEMSAPRFYELLLGRVGRSLEEIDCPHREQSWRNWLRASPALEPGRNHGQGARHGTRDAPAMLLALDAISMLVFWPQMQDDGLLARTRALVERFLERHEAFVRPSLPPILVGKLRVLLRCVKSVEAQGFDGEFPAELMRRWRPDPDCPLRVGVPCEGDLEVLLQQTFGWHEEGMDDEAANAESLAAVIKLCTPPQHHVGVVIDAATYGRKEEAGAADAGDNDDANEAEEAVSAGKRTVAKQDGQQPGPSQPSSERDAPPAGAEGVKKTKAPKKNSLGARRARASARTSPSAETARDSKAETQQGR